METSYLFSLLVTLWQDPKLVWPTIAIFLLLYSPIEGHLRSFYHNSSGLLSTVRLYFHDTREPFAITIAGQKWYILTDADDVSATYKINDGSLSYEIFAREVFRVIGVSASGVSKVFQTQDLDKQGTQYPEYKDLLALMKEFQVRQLYPGKPLDDLVRISRESLDNHMNLESVFDRGSWYIKSTDNGIPTVSLFSWVSDLFIGLGQEAYFGKVLEEIEPDLIQTFQKFDAAAWQVLYQYPKILSGPMLENKSKMQAAMERYFDLPAGKRDSAAYLILELEKEMLRLGISKSDRGIFFFQIYWSINGNTRKAPFWMLSYILYQPDLIEIIRKETNPAFSENGVDVAYLSKSCHILNSLWDETIRITASAASVRFLTKDIEIGNKILRKGNRIMMPQRQLHFDPKTFGADAMEFDAERFTKNPGLRRHPSLRPFGGGTSLCPGRFLAKQTTLTFIAMALNRFDIVLDPPSQPFPVPDEGKPTLALVDFVEGYDLKVKLHPRNT
ncbi:putative cytochrome p450 [Sclerotinia borealis F-4128]|uniref:Putative cytochrome p450 n=1 Tax=Sclerotinia borealis (strain F-4128) TaxID=1432307 RepID=W9CL92_SCLBF|nr:putative cytochrome p450 [Sclerotinia borealis F-4128]